MALEDIDPVKNYSVGFFHWSTDEENFPEANDAVEGTLWFRFNGTRRISVGRSHIDWTGAHIHHQEWNGQLMRFFHLDSLTKAWHETRESRYIQAAVDYILDWTQAHPAIDGKWQVPPRDCLLNLAIRIGNSCFSGWLGFLYSVKGSPIIDEPFREQLMTSVYNQIGYLRKNLTILGNWRICQADTLIAAGLRLEESSWVEQGVSIFNDEFCRQILPDGVHMECTPGYHHWVTQTFLNIWRLGKQRPDLGISLSEDRILAMLDYAAATMRPDGQLNAWNDSQSRGRNWWICDGSKARLKFLNEAGMPSGLPPLKAIFPYARQAAFRDDWTKDSLYWTFEGAEANPHSHLGKNGFQLIVGDTPLLVDPGYLSYEKSEPAAALGRSTRAHNTLNLNGWNQSRAGCSLFKHVSAGPSDLTVGLYEGGFWQGAFTGNFAEGTKLGISALHHRIIFRMHEVGFLIIDQMVREQTEAPEATPPNVEVNWQLPAEGTLDLMVERRQLVYRNHPQSLMAFFLEPDMPSRIQVHCGEENPMRGWMPSDSGLVPAPQVSVSRPCPGRYAAFVTVILPFQEEEPQVECSVSHPDPNFLSRVHLRWQNERVDEVTWAHRFTQPIARCDYFTDSPLVWRRFDEDQLDQVVHYGSCFQSKQASRRTFSANYWA